MSHPLQNRVAPTGDILAIADRGLFMGNRGGRIHDPATKTLLRRRWASPRWICCLTSFKGRQRSVMGSGYTELFFLDEPTALAAGHRPCFECRREDANAFAAHFPQGQNRENVISANAMDTMLHQDRLEGKIQRRFRARLNDLPDGVLILIGAAPFALFKGRLIGWTPQGYRATAINQQPEEVSVLTPKCTCETLANGYRPKWHPSAERAFADS